MINAECTSLEAKVFCAVMVRPFKRKWLSACTHRTRHKAKTCDSLFHSRYAQKGSDDPEHAYMLDNAGEPCVLLLAFLVQG